MAKRSAMRTPCQDHRTISARITSFSKHSKSASPYCPTLDRSTRSVASVEYKYVKVMILVVTDATLLELKSRDDFGIEF